MACVPPAGSFGYAANGSERRRSAGSRLKAAVL